MFLKFPSLLLIASVCFLSSCQQDVQEELNDDDDPVVVVPTGSFKAKIDGTQWVADRGAEAQRIQHRIVITGLGLDHKAVVLSLVDSGVHNYHLDAASMNVAAYVDSAGSNQLSFSTNESDDLSQAGGEVNITSIDEVNKKMSGTFSIRVYRMDDGAMHNFTEGSFTDIRYTTELAPGPGAATDTFRAKVNGANFTYQTIFAFNLGGQLVVEATSADGSRTLGMTLPPDIGPGTRPFEGLFAGTTVGLYNPDADPEHSQTSDSGTLTILEYNATTKRMRGTFSFHSVNILNTFSSDITEGYFSVKVN